MEFGYGVGKEYVKIFFSRVPHMVRIYFLYIGNILTGG